MAKNNSILTKDLFVINKLGVHARAAAKLVRCTARYASDIWIILGDKRVNAKSIMGVLMLGATKGTQLTLEVSGEDAEIALQAVVELFASRFDEDE